MSAETSLSRAMGGASESAAHTRQLRHRPSAHATSLQPATSMSTSPSHDTGHSTKPLTLDEGTADQALSDIPHSCPQCNKKFIRVCDLNKHSKSHSRPFKCPVPGCRYQEQGWPTAKELERHQNDKHSASPGQYVCHYRGCDYRSKRESNCKQHMEKTHGWTYVRSKPGSKGSRRSGGGSRQADAVVLEPGTAGGLWLGTTAAPGGSPMTFTSGAAHAMMAGSPILFREPEPCDILQQPDSGLQLNSAVDALGHHGAQGPWLSGGDRFHQSANLSQLATHTYVNSNARQRAGTEALLIDPRLCQPGTPMFGPLMTPESPAARDGVYPTFQSMLGLQEPLGTANVMSTLPEMDPSTPAPKLEQDTPVVPSFGSADPAFSTPWAQPSGEPGDQQHSVKTDSGQSSANKLSAFTREERSAQRESKRWRGNDGSDEEEEEDDEGAQPPRKRRKPPDATEISEDAMPCIFHHAHPDMYPPDPKDPKAPCYTQHKDISQLVRHLSRATHKLFVDARVVSSFDVTHESSYPHPVAGLCRTCWRSFDDRTLFEQHVKGTCPKISKGKMEKFNRLYETFCGLADDYDGPPEGARLSAAAGDVGPEDARAAAAAAAAGATRSGDGSRVDRESLPPYSADVPGTDAVVARASDVIALTERVHALERQYRNLAQATKVLWVKHQQSIAATASLQAPAAIPQVTAAATAMAGQHPPNTAGGFGLPTVPLARSVLSAAPEQAGQGASLGGGQTPQRPHLSASRGNLAAAQAAVNTTTARLSAAISSSRHRVHHGARAAAMHQNLPRALERNATDQSGQQRQLKQDEVEGGEEEQEVEEGHHNQHEDEEDGHHLVPDAQVDNSAPPQTSHRPPTIEPHEANQALQIVSGSSAGGGDAGNIGEAAPLMPWNEQPYLHGFQEMVDFGGGEAGGLEGEFWLPSPPPPPSSQGHSQSQSQSQ